MSSPAIGIDLGTTNSCVAFVEDGRAEVIANDQGNRTTPSWVAFTDNEVLVGEAAMNQADRNPENTLYGAKRMIGRRFNDDDLQMDITNWPFKVIDCNGEPKIEVKYQGLTQQFRPEHISALVLKKMKKTAEDYLGKTVTDAVITVPAYFNNSQRQATKNAGQIAGLNVLRIINEPTAAALSFGIKEKLNSTQKVLIFDLGGGTCDVSVASVVENQIKVHSTFGHTHLGGDDFDNLLVDHFAEDFKSKHGKDLSGSPLALLKLKRECEKTKRALSKCKKFSIEIHPLHEGIPFSSEINQARFGALCADKFLCTIDIVQKALNKAKMSPSDIDEVLLVGGSTRIPKIKEMLKDFFCGKNLNMKVHADEAVACGAALQAHALSNDTDKGKPLILDVVPMSLGVAERGVHFDKMIESNAQIPITCERHSQPVQDYQTQVLIRVFEGEHPLVKDNRLLGEFRLEGLTSAPADQVKLILVYTIDEDGILNVSAKEKLTGRKNDITITYLKSVSPQELRDMQTIVDMVDTM